MQNLIEKNQHISSLISNKYNWEQIKREYVEGYTDKENVQKWPTMKELSIKHGCPPAYLRRIASAQKWVIEKQNFVTNFEHALQEEKIKFLAKKAAKFDSRCIKLAETGIKKVEKYFGLNEDIVSEDGKRLIMTLDDLELAAKTLEKFQKIGRLALGSSTDNISKSIKTPGKQIVFADGLNTVMQQIENNTELKKHIVGEIVDE